MILRQPVKENFVYNNQQNLEVLESPVLDYKSSALRYKPRGGGVLPYITYTGAHKLWAPDLYGYVPPNGFVILKLLI